MIEDHWQYSLRENPITAGRMGVSEYNRQLPGVTTEDRARRLKTEQELLQRLQSIDTSKLESSDQVNRELLSWVLENSIEANQLFLKRIPLNTFSSSTRTV